MLVVADINTSWRKKPFHALSAHMSVLGLAPNDILSSIRGVSTGERIPSSKYYSEFYAILPPGWASKWTRLTAWRLWHIAQRSALEHHAAVSGLFVTSPHYLALVNRIEKNVPSFYYCSDDYSQYGAWGGAAMEKKEAEMVRAVKHSFFVSKTLADRAVNTYGVSASKVSVSPNATDDAFLGDVAAIRTEKLLEENPNLQRPLIGVVGCINGRLDFDLLNACVSSPTVGSLVMVGGVDPACSDMGLSRLQRNPKCVFVGQRPHEELPVWMQALDVALIAYRDTPLNRACSPMRLYDHLASGRPIVASHWCDQVREFSQVVKVAESTQQVVRFINETIACPSSREDKNLQMRIAIKNTWAQRAQLLANVISNI